MASERLVEAEQLSGSEREAHERAIAETLGAMYIGPLYPRVMGCLVLMMLYSRD
jgi:hypothetical protein